MYSLCDVKSATGLKEGVREDEGLAYQVSVTYTPNTKNCTQILL
jgi:hypothetical protein